VDPVSLYLLVGVGFALLSTGLACWFQAGKSFLPHEWFLLVTLGALWCLVAWPMTVVTYGVLALDIRAANNQKTAPLS